MTIENSAILPFRSWYQDWSELESLMIAGPCSAESFEQLAKTLDCMETFPSWQVLRLGVWKPRSRPGGFDGNPLSLEWIKLLKQQYKFKCMVEVATPEHVDLALNAQVDMVWIGARTVGLPFAVEDIATALSGTSIPVFIKNPLSPDISLWAGAVERFLLKGLNKLAIVHRGFSLPYGHELRNWPMWSAMAQMKLYFPDITLIGDPSHIAGDKKFVAKIANDALNFGCDGLMVETHPEPEKALSDAKQQIPLNEMNNFFKQLKKPEIINDHSQINYWRMHIDEIDQQIIHLLKKRDEVTENIAKEKVSHQLQVVDHQRFQSMLEKRKNWFDKKNGDHQFIDQVFHLLHDRSIQRQLNIFNESDSH